METLEAIYQRRSIRAYTDRPVSQTDLRAVLEAGLTAPSAVNLQPWYFVAIRSQGEMERLLEVMGTVSRAVEPSLRERFANHPAVVEETTSFIRGMGGAPVCVLAFQNKPDYGKTNETIIQSVAAAIENILLAAADKGLGSCWLTAPHEVGAGETLRALFAPEKGPLVAVLTLGYPAREPKAPPRKDGRYSII